MAQIWAHIVAYYFLYKHNACFGGSKRFGLGGLQIWKALIITQLQGSLCKYKKEHSIKQH
jgi:hypothetical protein